MNYQIITDQSILLEFIDWLPELKPEEKYYLTLIGRKKYCPELMVQADKAQLKRITSDKERMLHKIMQMECPLGSYVAHSKKLGFVSVPQQALALYISVNPRNLLKASASAVDRLLSLQRQPYNGYNPHAEVLSEIQKANSKKTFRCFDFDMPKQDYVKIHRPLVDLLGSALNVVETRGGFHILIKTSLLPKKGDWYKKMEDILKQHSSDTTNNGDIMLPVPGCIQGGFTPKMIIKGL